MKTIVRFNAVSRDRPAERRPVKDAITAALFATALFALIALLDGAASPNDISPGTAFAATLPTVAAEPAAGSETWSADTSAEGTRPDAIH